MKTTGSHKSDAVFRPTSGKEMHAGEKACKRASLDVESPPIGEVQETRRRHAGACRREEGELRCSSFTEARVEDLRVELRKWEREGGGGAE